MWSTENKRKKKKKEAEKAAKEAQLTHTFAESTTQETITDDAKENGEDEPEPQKKEILEMNIANAASNALTADKYHQVNEEQIEPQGTTHAKQNVIDY